LARPLGWFLARRRAARPPNGLSAVRAADRKPWARPAPFCLDNVPATIVTSGWRGDARACKAKTRGVVARHRHHFDRATGRTKRHTPRRSARSRNRQMYRAFKVPVKRKKSAWPRLRSAISRSISDRSTRRHTACCAWSWSLNDEAVQRADPTSVCSIAALKSLSNTKPRLIDEFGI
jgi:hypothetical protein